MTYTVLQRDAESNRELYQTLLRREKELQVLANSRGNNVRLVERAAIPQVPFSPNLRRAMMLGAIVAFLVAVGLVLGLDYLDDTIKTPEDITRLGLPFLALIPAVRAGRERPMLSGHNEFSEAIRSLRTSIALSTRQGGSIVLVTSAQPLEGKTTTACNLATALAYGGAKVLLIDADMRRPGVHRNFGLENRCGLSELLSGQAHLTQAVQRLAEPDLWIMPAGSTPPNPSELLASGRMEALLGSGAERPVRLGDRRHAACPRGHRCLDSHAVGIGCRLRGGIRNDAPAAGGTSHRDTRGRAAAHPGRGTQPRRCVAEQVLLREALRLREQDTSPQKPNQPPSSASKGPP